jgi:predicted Ser/Thr protein kinase
VIDAGALPRKFGKYTLVREMGRGAMGAVYEARDDELGRRVAVKLMLPGDSTEPREIAKEEQLFAREAQMLAKLAKHPNIVTVYEAGVLDARRFIAMEHVQGRPLGEWREGAELRPQVRLLRDVALAVHHAHEAGILHRDLKPANVLVDAQDRPHVTDFGMAKLLGAEGNGGSSTVAGTVIGTPSYMSPEQAQGLKKIDRRADVYALGAMLYEFLAGRPAVEGRSSIVTLMKVVQDPVPPPSHVNPKWAGAGTDRILEQACLKAMSKRPEDRFGTARAFADELSKWIGPETQPLERPVEAAPRKRTDWAYAVAPALALVALGVLALIAMRLAVPADPWKDAPNVLSLADPAKDALEGAWSVEQGAFISPKAGRGRLEIPYRPPAEYDLRLSFGRREGDGAVVVMLSRDGRPFAWVMGAQGNRVFGFADIGGLGADQNDSTRRRSAGLPLRKALELVLEVRNDAVRAFLDRELVTEWKTNYSDLAMPKDWALRDGALLGLGTDGAEVVVERVEILELTGKGSRSR